RLAGGRAHPPRRSGLPGPGRPGHRARRARPRLGRPDAAGRSGRRGRDRTVRLRRAFGLSLGAFHLGFPHRMAGTRRAGPRGPGTHGRRRRVIGMVLAADAVRDRAAALEREHGVRLTLVDNDRAEEWNNAYSLWLAREHFAKGALLV